MTSLASRLPKWIIAVITSIIYVTLMLHHENVGAFIGAQFKSLGRARYDQVVVFGGGAIIVLFAIFLVLKMQRNLIRRKTALFYLGITLVCAALAVKYLLVIKIEMVHFLQYGVLGALVFLLLRRYTLTALVVYLMALGDEAYQHWFLKHNKFAYYDFNDVWLNLIGMGFGLTAFYTIGAKVTPRKRIMLDRLLILYGLLILAFIVLYVTGIIGIWPAEDGSFAPVQLMYQHIDGFWSKGWKHNTYHVLRPLPGVLIHVITIVFYSLLDQAPQD